MAMMLAKNNNSTISPIVNASNAPVTSRGTIKEAHNEDEYDEENDSSERSDSSSSNWLFIALEGLWGFGGLGGLHKTGA